MSKVCKGCEDTKYLHQFGTCKTRKGEIKLRHVCKTCRNKHRRKSEKERLKDPVKLKAYRKRKRDYKRNRRANDEEYRIECNKKQREWLEKNPEKKKAKNKRNTAYQSNRRRTDPQYRMRRNIAKRASMAIKENGFAKKVSFSKTFGCTPNELNKRFENLFTTEMTWSNYAEVWEVDHIRPVSKFNMSSVVEQQRMNHYLNLQPMLILENNRKSNKWTEEQELNYQLYWHCQEYKEKGVYF